MRFSPNLTVVDDHASKGFLDTPRGKVALAGAAIGGPTAGLIGGIAGWYSAGASRRRAAQPPSGGNATNVNNTQITINNGTSRP